MGRWGRKLTMLLNDLKGNRKYFIWKKKVLLGTMWITRFERGYGFVARQTGHRIYIYYSFVLNFQRYAMKPKMLYDHLVVVLRFTRILTSTAVKHCYSIHLQSVVLGHYVWQLSLLPYTIARPPCFLPWMWEVRTNGTSVTSNGLNIVPQFVNINQKQRSHSIIMYLAIQYFLLGRKLCQKVDRFVIWIYECRYCSWKQNASRVVIILATEKYSLWRISDA